MAESDLCSGLRCTLSRMKQLRLAPIGILALASIIALIVACSSDSDQTQQTQQQQSAAADQQQPEEVEQAGSAASSEGSDTDQRQSTATTTSEAQEQIDESAAEDDDSNQPTATRVTASGEDEEESPAQDSADQQQTRDQQAQDQAQGQPDSDPEDTQQAEEAEQPEAEQEEMTQEQTSAQAEAEHEQQSDPAEVERLRLRAEEISAAATITDVVGLNAWLNGAETSIAFELARGNVVLIDFWTYTCINCVRTLPFLTAWDRKYRDHGLVIIGVHTPEFAFEERLENVQEAIAEHGIEYLVAIDNDYRTWRAFQNRWWPRKFLIGPTDDGSPMGVRYDHIGEGHYEETEHAIRQALEAVGRDLSDIPFGVDVAVPVRQGGTPRQTRELYAGWRRNVGSGGPYAGQDAYFLAGTGIDTLYRDIPTSDRQHNFWYLEGLWRIEDESVVHARETKDLEDYMALLVRGRTANVVLTVAEDGQPYRVYVEVDGRWVFPPEAGEHIQWDDEGRSYIDVTQNDLYRLLFLPEWSEHELKLRSNSDQFRIFAFTFGSYVGGQ